MASWSSEIEIETEKQSSRPATSNGGSSSTAADTKSSSSNNVRYDVFINHRGEVKKTFASFLYRSLLSRGLRPFLDQHELQAGLDFPSQLKDAIRTALVHVAIFSRKYAESQWCLDELVLMLESGAPVIPVFYDIRPAEIRWTDQNKGVYAGDLNQLQMKKTYDSKTDQEKPRYDSATIQKWKNALSTAANISGFDLVDGPFNGDEGLMVHKLMESVVNIINENAPLYVAKYPTGLDDKVAEFETVLRQQHSGKVKVLGIIGLGGAGKTTLALELFNRERSKYSKSYFLSDVRENANKRSLHSLQRELLKGLTQSDHFINNINEGIGKLKLYLESSHVLLILDDIDHEDQLEAFLPLKDVISSNSLILITSRDRDALLRSGVDKLSIYKLTGLTQQQSRELFCSYAFCQVYPLEGFENLVNKFLQVCEGLPLSLKVLGALLFGRDDKSDWEDILHRLTVPKDIQKKLRISYDALSVEEQQIFLDITCFFIGEDRNSAITVWNGSGWRGSLGFKNLEAKCLVEVDSENVIHHDHLRDLGREIAEDKLPRRLWPPPEKIYDLLHRHSSATTEIRGIRMLPPKEEARGIKMHSTEGGSMSSKMVSWYQWRSHKRLAKSAMKLCNRLHMNIRYRFLGISFAKLQLLDTEGHLLERLLRRVHSPNLIWLSWRDCPYSYLPSWIPMKNLRVLKVEGRVLETLWRGESQAPLQLQELEIIDAEHLSNIPKSIGQLKHLERIIILSSPLAKLPEEIYHMKSLRVLLLRNCQMKSLPESFGNLANLQHMDLSWCKELERLPDTLGNLANLQHMDLSYCKKLERLPDSFGHLVNLQHMDLSRCEKLERLPDSFGNLVNLQHMSLSVCKQLRRLPDSLGNLVNLQRMDLSRCERLEGLPDSLGHLANLQRMDLSWCEKLKMLPDSLGNLANLQHMSLSVCRKLKRLSDSFGNLVNLRHMELFGCDILEMLPDSFGNLGNLQHMDLSRSKKLERLPDSFGNLANLQHMDLYRCDKLERLPDSLGNLANLQHMDLSGCEKLESLPDSFGNLANIQHMDLSGCEKLETLPNSFGNLANLQEMYLLGCHKLKRLPGSFGCLRSLKSFEASGCSNLTISSDTLGNIRTLEHIDLSDCEKIEVLPSQLAHQRSLKILKLTGTKLKELPSAIAVLSDLELLWIGSPFLDMLPPSLSDLRSLKELKLKECRELKHVPASIGLLNQLTSLEVTGCPAMELPFKMVNGQREAVRTLKSNSSIHKYMSGLQHLLLHDTEISEVSFDENVCPNLQHFTLHGNGNLAVVGKLPSTLVELELIRCSNLRNIEGLCGLAKLQTLKIYGCKELHELPSIKTLVSLKKLEATGCVKLKSIRDLAQLTKLQSINVSGCLELEELEGIENCISLGQLCVGICPSLHQWGEEVFERLRQKGIHGSY